MNHKWKWPLISIQRWNIGYFKGQQYIIPSTRRTTNADQRMALTTYLTIETKKYLQRGNEWGKKQKYYNWLHKWDNTSENGVHLEGCFPIRQIKSLEKLILPFIQTFIARVHKRLDSFSKNSITCTIWRMGLYLRILQPTFSSASVSINKKIIEDHD